jgi:hypothetical protein
MAYNSHDGMKARWQEINMSSNALRSEIKMVGKSGQISLGKSYAGKTLRLQQRADGSILLTAVALIPESQLWTLEEPHRTAIAKGLAWAAETPPAETDLDELIQRTSKPKKVGGRARADSK